MSGANAAADPSRKRRLRSWASAAAAADESTAVTNTPSTPAAASASAAQSSGTAPQRKKARRQQLLAAAFGNQPRPPRWRDFSPAQRCFSDGLALAFSFLSLFELIPAALTCRSWRDAAVKVDVPGVELRNVFPDGSYEEWLGGVSAGLRSLVSSPFRRHVHALIYDDDPDVFELPADDDDPTPEWTQMDLAMLQHLPQLRRLSDVRVELASTLPDEAFSFPPLIESADLLLSFDVSLLDADDDDWDTESVQRLVLEALRPCHSLTELSITLHPWTALCLDGLLELSTLQILTLDIERVDEESESSFSEAQMGVVKQLPNLRDLSLRECDEFSPIEADLFGTRWLRWLCPMPHRLQRLEELDLSQQCLDLEHMQLLQRLPALTAIEPAGICDPALPLLSVFASRLQRLGLRFIFLGDEETGPELVDFETEFARGPLLLPHLTPCAALTDLALSNCVFTEDDATALCQALKQLRDLDLHDVSWPSFESLRHLPLLESFSLRWARVYPLALQVESAHFKPLQRLRHISLSNLSPLLDAAKSVIAALRPPSSLLPELAEFDFSS